MRRGPLGLGLYLALTRTGVKGPHMAAPSDLPRPDAPPDAPVVWMHIGLRPRHSALAPWVSLAQRLLAQRGDVQIVITTPTPLPDRAFEALPPDQDLVVRLVPEESAPEIAQFLARVRPTVALWVGNDLRPALMHATTRTGCRMIALDMRDTRFGVPTLRWLSDKAAQVLDLCSDAVAVDTAAMMRLRRLGLRHVTLHQRGALPDNPVPPDCPPEDLAQATRTLDGRTVWLAACVAVDELDTVLRAHRLASRYAHRLLLILMPEAGVCADQVRRAVDSVGLRSRPCHSDAAPDPLAQVLICDDPDTLGVWYRIAPICFLGQSLVSGRGGIDPAPAATLGSAILYGPNVSRYMDTYDRYAAAGAARLVRDPNGLAQAVTTVLAPDEAAAMAQAAWDLVTAGADLTDWLVDTVIDTLDTTEEM